MLLWSDHINKISTKAIELVHSIRLFKYKMCLSTLNRCYLSFICPLLEYRDLIFDNCYKNTIENSKYNALLLITGCKEGTLRQLLLEETGLCTLRTRLTFHKEHSIPNLFRQPLSLLTCPLGNSRNTTTEPEEFEYLGHRSRTSYVRASFLPSSTFSP